MRRSCVVCVFASPEFAGAESLTASHRWVSIKFRRHEGIPSPTWLYLKVEFSSVSNIGLQCNVIKCVSLPSTRSWPGKTWKRQWNGAESQNKATSSKCKAIFWCVILVLSETFTRRCPLLVLCRNHLIAVTFTTGHPQTASSRRIQLPAISPMLCFPKKNFLNGVIIDGGVCQGRRGSSVKSTQAAVQSRLTSALSYATKSKVKKQGLWVEERVEMTIFHFWTSYYCLQKNKLSDKGSRRTHLCFSGYFSHPRA